MEIEIVSWFAHRSWLGVDSRGTAGIPGVDDNSEKQRRTIRTKGKSHRAPPSLSRSQRQRIDRIILRECHHPKPLRHNPLTRPLLTSSTRRMTQSPRPPSPIAPIPPKRDSPTLTLNQPHPIPRLRTPHRSRRSHSHGPTPLLDKQRTRKSLCVPVLGVDLGCDSQF